MAVNVHAVLKTHNRISRPKSGAFRRIKEHTTVRKVKRKIKLTSQFIILSTLSFCAIFFGIQQVYLFLLTWEKLDITHVEVISVNPEIREEILNIFTGQDLGNILLLDTYSLQKPLTEHRWIADVRIRKNYPDGITIEVHENRPAAVIRKDALIMIDRKGMFLDPYDPAEYSPLPILTDDANFEGDITEKLQLAWRFLDDLSLEERELVEIIDLSEYENVRAKLKGSSTWLIFGNERFSEKLMSYFQSRPLMERFGTLEYVELRVEGAFFIKPRKGVN